MKNYSLPPSLQKTIDSLNTISSYSNIFQIAQENEAKMNAIQNNSVAAMLSSFTYNIQESLKISTDITNNLNITNHITDPLTKWCQEIVDSFHNIDDHTKEMKSIQNILNSQITEMTQYLIESTYMFQDFKQDLYNNTVVTELNSFRTTLIELANQIQFIIPQEIYTDTHKRIICLALLSEARWPLFFENNEPFLDEIIKTNQIKDIIKRNEKITNIVFEYCDDKYISSIIKFWSYSKAINKKRIPILIEALDNYKESRYYSCTSLLVEQAMGIIKDIFNLYNDEKELPKKQKSVFDTSTPLAPHS